MNVPVRALTWACAGILLAEVVLGEPVRESVVFVAAHPDDTEGFAATAFLLKEKYDLYVVDFTGGERGCGEVKYLSGWTKAKRAQEEKEALAMLGTEPLFVGEIDGEACATPRAIATLTRFLRQVRPRAVFTHWPVDEHPDHRNCSIATIAAVEQSGNRPEFYFYEVLLDQTRNWHPIYSVDVSSTMKLKQELLAKYECQNPDNALVKEKTAQAAIRGKTRVPAVPYAETFATFDGRPLPGGVLAGLKECVPCR